jgi:hypothetical protein
VVPQPAQSTASAQKTLSCREDNSGIVKVGVFAARCTLCLAVGGLAAGWRRDYSFGVEMR